MKRRVTLGPALRALCGVALAACGGLSPAFDARFPDVEHVRDPALLARIAPPPGPRESPGLVATTLAGGVPGLVFYDLQQASVRWRLPLSSRSRPELLGDLVLITRDTTLVGLDARTGRTRFERPLDACEYLGAARDRERIFYTCTLGPQSGHLLGRARVTALDARSGTTLWQREAGGALGRPAAANGVVLVPFQQQWLALIDAANGAELQRLRARDDVIDWVRADAGLWLYGHRRLHRIANGSSQPLDIRLQSEALPGKPAPFESAFLPQPGARSARGRIALHVRPEAAAGVRIANDRAYFVFYRYVFGLDAAGRLVWARILPRDVVAGQALADGLLVVLEDGELLVLSLTTGDVRSRLAIGSELAAADLSTAGWTPPARPPAAADASPSLRQALTAIALDSDARLVPARNYAVAQLAADDDPDATADLLRVYQQNAVPPELARAAADGLRSRRRGLEHLVAALDWHYDFLEQTRQAPLSVVVPPLVEGHERRALPGLFERLHDPETPLTVLPLLVHAIGELGDERVVDPLFAWLRLYRADSSLAQIPEALVDAAAVIARRGGERGRRMLASLPSAPQSTAALRDAIARLREPASPAAVRATVEPPAASQPEPPTLPDTLSAEAVATTFAQHAQELDACVQQERARDLGLHQVRVAFIAESDGSAHAVRYAPHRPPLADCLDPKVSSLRFPAFRGGRKVASYTLGSTLRSGPEPATAREPATASEPWWAWYAQRADGSQRRRARRPWWRSRQPLAPLVERPTEATGSPPAYPTAPDTTNVPAEPAAAGVPTPPTPARPASEDSWWVPAPAPSAPAPAPPARADPPADTWWVPTQPAAPRDPGRK